jgi:hypothetical protein
MSRAAPMSVARPHRPSPTPAPRAPPPRAAPPQDAGERAKQMLAAAEAAKTGTFLQVVDGKFVDDRWVGGRWDLAKFGGADGKTDWDKVGVGEGAGG